MPTQNSFEIDIIEKPIPRALKSELFYFMGPKMFLEKNNSRKHVLIPVTCFMFFFHKIMWRTKILIVEYGWEIA